MADINLTNGDDVYVQPEADKNVWNNVFGLEGNDTIRMYQGTAIGGRGNDRFEKLNDPDNPNRELQVAYWNAGDNLKVNLAEGWAEDGQGGRDTLVGVLKIHGSGSKNAWVQGDANNNYYWPNGADDVYLGGAGWDGVSLNSSFEPSPGTPWRQALWGEIDIQVSADGSKATIKPKFGQGFLIQLTDVEYFDVMLNQATNTWQQLRFADFILPQAMATEAIAAGGSLRWNASQALGSAVTVSFSFVTQSTQPGFRAFTAAEQQAVRDILAKTAQITQLSFAEVSEFTGSAGQLRLGVSQQPSSKGQAFLPGQMGEQAGDVWMDVESMVNLAVGSEGYQALLHEIGHALGLRHPRNVDAGDAWGVQLREQDDRLALSVMSQVPSSDGLFRAEWGLLDVLALRHLYGTKTINTTDTTYLLGSRESSAMTTVIDDGGSDTINAAASPIGVSLDLEPGHVGSIGLTPAGVSAVDNLAVGGSTMIENAIGSPFDDVLLGNPMANQLSGGSGNDWIDGADGIDTAVFGGKRSDYELSGAYGKVYVKARDGVSGYDTLVNIERAQFADQTLALSSTVFSADSNFSVDEDQALKVALPDPSDMARSAVTYKLVAQSANGASSISADGQLNYQPKANFAGLDLITYEISNGTAANRYTSFVQVAPVNDGPPVAASAKLLMPGGPLVRGKLPAATDPDNDPISYAVATQSRNGDVIVHSDGSFSYQAKGGFAGSDTFSFIVGDGLGGTNVYTLTLDVNPVTSLIEGSTGNDNLFPSTSTDGYSGGAGNDRITGGGGNDLIDGGSGIDTSIYANPRSQYFVARTDTGWAVTASVGSEGSDKIASVERLQFGNVSLALDLDGNAGAVAQIIRALLGNEYLPNKDFVGIGLSLFDSGVAYADVVTEAIGIDLFRQLAGNTNEGFVSHLYENVIGVLPSAGELATYVGLLNSGVYTKETLALAACQVGFNTASADLVGLASTGIEFTPPG